MHSCMQDWSFLLYVTSHLIIFCSIPLNKDLNGFRQFEGLVEGQSSRIDRVQFFLMKWPYFYFKKIRKIRNTSENLYRPDSVSFWRRVL
ncbi:uncharacterized protein [Parasteatoda tepidariorum]|uniref:uncharacterized protein isoform X2 n=1 Tax=Parasteatoda tepidariorum TaxID=114398 RepID=UPI0039BC2ACD